MRSASCLLLLVLQSAAWDGLPLQPLACARRMAYWLLCNNSNNISSNKIEKGKQSCFIFLAGVDEGRRGRGEWADSRGENKNTSIEQLMKIEKRSLASGHARAYTTYLLGCLIL
ncbi:hypothetical protein BX070DRAFT_78489 [Coemansia spiralis]|nr:hypothetical protein BX070DRAFT_78489 [Coemansia spiralis]